MKRVVITVASLLGVMALLVTLIAASGLQFYTVMTPSMGQTAPVGSLVAAHRAADYQVGEIVTYERNARSYTHRIITINSDGTYITKGDLNTTPDALPVAKAEVIGRVIWIGPGLGWLWQGLPWLILGGIVVHLLSLVGRMDRSWRWVVRISGWVLVFVLVAMWIRPWVSLSMLGFTPAASGVDMHVVNTGLFPLDVLGNRLVSGQDAVVNVTAQDANGRYTLTPGLAFRWWEQLAIYVLCLIPMAISLLIRTEAPAAPTRAVVQDADAEPDETASDPNAETAVDELAESPNSDADDRSRHRRRLMFVAALVVMMMIAVAIITFAVTTNSAQAALTDDNPRLGLTHTTAAGRLPAGSATTQTGVREMILSEEGRDAAS